MDEHRYCNITAAEPSHNIFNLKYSDLPKSSYSYFLHGFQDEADFEEFKQDLKAFQKLKDVNAAKNVYRNSYGRGLDDDERYSYKDVEEDISLICRPNAVRTCQNRKKCKHTRKKGFSDSELQGNVTDLKRSGTDSSDNDSNKLNSVNSTKANPRPLSKSVKLQADCFGLREDFDRRSGLYERRSVSLLGSSINDILMDFMNGDEHFLEFERVFETVNSKRFSRIMDNRKSVAQRENANDKENCVDKTNDSEDTASEGTGNIFTDFFDNDEDFLEFEKEFEKFRSARRSHLLGSLSSLGSSRDIFGDVKAYYRRNSRSNSRSGSLLSVNSCSLEGEAAPSCPDELGDQGDTQDGVWRSAEDWEKLLKKMKRHSRILSGDVSRPSCKRRGSSGQQRHSTYGMLQGRCSGDMDRYQKTQSLADLTSPHLDDTCSYDVTPGASSSLRSSSINDGLHNCDILGSRTVSCSNVNPESKKGLPDIRIEHVHTGDSFAVLPGCDNFDPLRQDVLTHETGIRHPDEDSDCYSASMDRLSDTSTDGIRSFSSHDSSDDDARYSSTSTLCSNDGGDMSFSPSLSGCSCCSADLYIDEDTDYEDVATAKCPSKRTARGRSQSLDELKGHHHTRGGGHHAVTEHKVSFCDNVSQPLSHDKHVTGCIPDTDEDSSMGVHSRCSITPTRDELSRPVSCYDNLDNDCQQGIDDIELRPHDDHNASDDTLGKDCLDLPENVTPLVVPPSSCRSSASYSTNSSRSISDFDVYESAHSDISDNEDEVDDADGFDLDDDLSEHFSTAKSDLSAAIASARRLAGHSPETLSQSLDYHAHTMDLSRLSAAGLSHCGDYHTDHTDHTRQSAGSGLPSCADPHGVQLDTCTQLPGTVRQRDWSSRWRNNQDVNDVSCDYYGSLDRCRRDGNIGQHSAHRRPLSAGERVGWSTC